MPSVLQRWRSSPALIVAVLVIIVALGGAAVAAIPSSDGVIHGCYKQEKGQLRVIDAGAGNQCRKSEAAIAWNQQGPKNVLQKEDYDALTSNPSAVSSTIGGHGGAVAL